MVKKTRSSKISLQTVEPRRQSEAYVDGKMTPHQIMSFDEWRYHQEVRKWHDAWFKNAFFEGITTSYRTTDREYMQGKMSFPPSRGSMVPRTATHVETISVSSSSFFFFFFFFGLSHSGESGLRMGRRRCQKMSVVLDPCSKLNCSSQRFCLPVRGVNGFMCRVNTLTNDAPETRCGSEWHEPSSLCGSLALTEEKGGTGYLTWRRTQHCHFLTVFFPFPSRFHRGALLSIINIHVINIYHI